MKHPKTPAIAAALAFLTSAAIADKGMGSMAGMHMGTQPEAAAQGSHKASGIVKKVNEKTATVTLQHGPVPSLDWPAMTMGFKVKDRSLMPKLTEGKSVNVEFTKSGGDYVITGAE